MKHTDAQLEQAAARFIELSRELEDSSSTTEDANDLHAIATAADDVRTDEARLRKAVDIARSHGRSWNRIALALGVSRQAARQRFGSSTAKSHQ